ncbi:MAG: hypothetical protein E6H04_11790, partial [Bacillati bacterium ANGP1]
MVRALAWLALAPLVVGCGGRPPHPTTSSLASEAPAPAASRGPRIAVVDLARASRVHPRWPEVIALDRQIGELEARIAIASGPAARVDLPKIDLTPEMKAAMERMRPEFEREAEAVKAAARQDLAAYVAQLRAEQEKQLAARRAEVEAELAKAVREKQVALDADTQQFQQQAMVEYRLP